MAVQEVKEQQLSEAAVRAAGGSGGCQVGHVCVKREILHLSAVSLQRIEDG